MAKLFPPGRTGRTTGLALMLAVSTLTTAAYADDDYGTGGESAILRAAASTPAAPLSSAETQALSERFMLGESDAFGAATAPRPGPFIAKQASQLASTTPMVSGTADVVGGGGHQDQLAREIYRPGSGTSW